METSTKKLFIWWASMLLTMTGLFWSYYLGFVTEVWVTDITMITSIILVMFFSATLFLGKGLHDYRKKDDLQGLMKRSDLCWFVSEQMMALGMLGTVIGLIHMLATGFGDTTSLNDALPNMWKSMGLALYTNAVGIAFSIILKLQVYFVTYGLIDEKQEV